MTKTVPRYDASVSVNRISMDDLRGHYQRPTYDGQGRHWFDADTMRFFRSRLPFSAFRTEDRTKAYFVTSEQYDYKSPRLFTVRVYDFGTREIATVGEFQAYRSRSAAERAAIRLANGEEV